MTKPDDVMILLLEMQAPIVASSATLGEADLRRGAAVVRRLADALALPLFASVVPLGEHPPALIAELTGLEAHTRTVVSPFADPDMRRALSDSGRRTLAIGGVSTEIAVQHTALDARRAGYDVHILADACGGLSARTEATAFDRMRAAGATIDNISSFVTELAGDMASDDGRVVMDALAELWGWRRG